MLLLSLIYWEGKSLAQSQGSLAGTRKSASRLSLRTVAKQGWSGLGCEPPPIAHCKSFLLYVEGQLGKNLKLRQSRIGRQVDQQLIVGLQQGLVLC